MAAQRYKDFLFSYSGLISSSEEIQIISDYFAYIQKNVTQAEFSEIMNLQKYSVVRNSYQIKKLLKENRENPFVFITCLN